MKGKWMPGFRADHNRKLNPVVCRVINPEDPVENFMFEYLPIKFETLEDARKCADEQNRKEIEGGILDACKRL